MRGALLVVWCGGVKYQLPADVVTVGAWHESFRGAWMRMRPRPFRASNRTKRHLHADRLGLQSSQVYRV